MISLNGRDLTIEQVIRVTRGYEEVKIAEEAKAPMDKARAYVEEKVASGAAIYGLTTGFGKFQDKYISIHDTATLQRNLIVSHACGMGEPFAEDITRGIMLLRCNALCRGNSGIRRSTVETLIAMLNARVHPIIPQKGSLGASGDLAPLAHMVLVMIGEGEAVYNGERMSGADAMARAGIPTVELAAKEGLALINGTQVMTSTGLHTLYGAMQLAKTADIAAAMTAEAQLGITKAFDAKVHELRGHGGQMDCAANIRKLIDGSGLCAAVQQGKVQDAYSVRCVPQIHGASRDAIEYVRAAVSREINAVTDNPLIFREDRSGISGGNFHGQPMALSFDFLKIAESELADVSERRIERLVNPAYSGLPAFLTPNGGVNSGFMIVQYSAAALVSENKVLAHPASVDSIPSSAGQEDHVSMGTIAARQAGEIGRNVRRVLAMELMVACQGIDMRGNKGLGKGTQAAYDLVRKCVARLDEDRELYEDINYCEKIIEDGSLIRAVEEALGAEIEY